MLRSDGLRTVRGCCTDLLATPFKEELEAWEVNLWLRGQFKCLIGCSQDIKCQNHLRSAGDVCRNCQIPVCNVCNDALTSSPPTQPCIALANDMWSGFSSEYIYKNNVTYLELLSASPCCVSLICFVLQEAYDQKDPKDCCQAPKRAMFLEPAFVQKQRTAARGNITMWPMPLSDILQEMKRLNLKTIWLRISMFLRQRS